MAIDLTTVGTTTLGSVIQGQIGFVSENAGWSLSSAGDMNGDGFEDMIIGAPSGGFYYEGRSYVVFGSASPLPAASLAALGPGGFRVTGVYGGTEHTDQAGWSVSGAGDVNGDGFADVVIGAPEYGFDYYLNPMAGGHAYVVFGHSGAFGNIDLSSAPLDGTDGFQLVGEAVYDAAGWSVSDAGDVNGDGLKDLLVGAQQADSGAGKTYVVYGKASGFGDTVDLSDVAGGTGGFAIGGAAAGDQGQQSQVGHFVSSAGDINGDGFDDLMISGRYADAGGGTGNGGAFVLFGARSGLASLDLGTAVLDGGNGFTIVGGDDGDRAGWSISDVGDVNGDGFRDLAVGAPYASSGDGAAYVVFGKASGFAAQLDLSALGTDGFAIEGASGGADRVGRTVSSAGDLNGDGYDDLVVSSFFGAEAYVVFGKASGFGALDVATLSGDDGFKIQGFSGAPGAVSAAGDVNGDGFDDLLVADQADSTTYLILGAASLDGSTNHVTNQGTAGADGMAGTGAANVMIGGRGNDVLIGNGGADVLRGGEGADALLIADAGFLRIDGGTGQDVLSIQGPMTLSDGDFRRIADIEGLKLGNFATLLRLGAVASHAINGVASNGFALTIDGSAVTDKAIKLNATSFGRGVMLDLSSDSASVTLLGGAGNDALTGGSGKDILFGGAGNDALAGGDGADWAIYRGAGVGVQVSLATILAQNTVGAGTDTLNGIEHLQGSAFHDLLTGDGGSNLLVGLAGNDTLRGGGGNDGLDGGVGDDSLDGGGGTDLASYARSGAAVQVDLGVSVQQNTGGAGLDTLVNIERLVGSIYGDVLTGDGQANLLQGGDGDDSLNGAGGSDRFKGGAGADHFVFDQPSALTPETELIVDYEAQDVVDLSGIDADSAAGGDQGFTVVAGPTGAAGDLWIKYDGVHDRTIVRGDLDGDKHADFTLVLLGEHDQVLNPGDPDYLNLVT
ncbi:MAG TPA: hypothetical protein VF559_07410 [Caulobacteraceae bacterium]|jgi:Ca2+-binding RTX toxin-like protein